MSEDWRVEILRSLNGLDCLRMTPKEKNIFAYLIGREDVYMKDIERDCLLSQPEVSVALSNLKEKGLVEWRRDPETVEGKGRPRRLYTISSDWYDYIDRSVEDTIDHMERRRDKIRQTVINVNAQNWKD